MNNNNQKLSAKIKESTSYQSYHKEIGLKEQ